MVKFKLVLLIFLYFCTTNQVMQNPIPKLKQSSIIFKKPGFSSEKLKTLTSSIIFTILIFFAEILHTFST